MSAEVAVPGNDLEFFLLEEFGSIIIILLWRGEDALGGFWEASPLGALLHQEFHEFPDG